ncbi:DMT family transporter [Microbacterium azadirachtae]|uniref:Putative inner membrane transporter yiJE n=1 Tax=Microbacterium azadirachtae TaxID=582680 RepID=A0A0F0LJM0_9MICO|nr:DMT family transporter [Microbacterium azadirachtae]KJL33402.1 putative inner membrane transporter yiJE [Microbacterium azadirachtae]
MAAPSRSAVLTASAYLALALTWGSSFLLMKVSLDSFSPAQIAIGRILIGALTLGALMALTRRRWPRERRIWGHMTVVAVFLCVLPFLLFAWAETLLPSGIAAVINATTPIWTAIATALTVRGARLHPGQVVGVLLGLCGVALAMGAWQVVSDPAFLASFPAQLACLGATASYGIAFTWMQRFVAGRHHHDALSIAAVQLTAAAAIGLLLAPFLALDPIRGGFAPAPVLALTTLGMLGTGLAYIWNTRVLSAWGAIAAASVTYLTPLVGIALGVILLAEPLTWYEPVGALVIILSVLLVQRRFDGLLLALRRRPSEAAAV